MRSSLWPALAMLVAACARPAERADAPRSFGPDKSGQALVSARARIDNIARASLFEPRDIAQLDTRAGRQFARQEANLPNDVTIECYFQATTFRGTTPKFTCTGPADPGDSTSRRPVIVTDASGNPVDVTIDRIKVRYGSVKVFAAVITTRLEWALGFGSDVETPVAKVICHGCSRAPFGQAGPINETHEFPKPGDVPRVSVEQEMAGTRISVAGMRFARDNDMDSPSWRWDELNAITDPERRAEADALRLFVAFIQDVDNKALQNELLCRSTLESSGACPDPFLYIHDLGNSLGNAGSLLGLFHTIHPLDLAAWKHVRVWQDEAACVAALQMISRNGPGLTDPVISEAGRRLLADRLTRLIDARNADGSSKLGDIFRAAHIDQYDDHGSHFTADDWVDVFIMRARQITEKQAPCPQRSPLLTEGPR